MIQTDKYIELINKYLSNDIDKSDYQLLMDWVKKDEHNTKLFEEYKKAWELSQRYDSELESIKIDDEWAWIEQKLFESKKTRIISLHKANHYVWLKIAASILIILITGSVLIYIFSGKETALISSSNILENKLPDGSIISLNYNSTLSYKASFNEEKRVVKLSGEAFFNIKPDKKKPFIVEVEDLKVEVVGTSFNIRQLTENKTVEIFVETGRVQLYNANKDVVYLQANESATYYSDSKSITKMEIPDINYLSWKSKLLNFDNSSLEYIVNTLKRCYNAEIIINNPDLKFCSLTVSFQNQSLESALKVLEATLDIKIEKKNDIFEISGNGCPNSTVK